MRKGWAGIVRFDHLAISLLLGIILIAAVCSRIPAAAKIITLLLISLTIQMLTSRPTDNSFQIRVVSNTIPFVNPFFAKGYEIADPMEYAMLHSSAAADGYYSRTPNAGGRRLSTYPPGLPIMYWTIFRISGLMDSTPPLKHFKRLVSERIIDSEAMQIYPEGRALVGTSLICVLINIACFSFGVALCYFLALIVCGYPQRSLFAACMLSFIPSVNLYANASDMLLMPFSLCIALLAFSSIKYGWRYLLVADGILISAGLFLSFAFLPLLVFVLISCAIAEFQAGMKPKRLAAGFGVLAAGMSIPMIAMLFMRYDPIRMFFIAMSNNREFYAFTGRTYQNSILSNLTELTIYTGFILVPAFLFSMARTFAFSLKSARGDATSCAEGLPLKHIFVFSFGIVFLFIMLSGSVRGEVSRNLIMFMPFFVISAVLDESFSKKRFVVLSMIMLISSLILCAVLETTFAIWM